MARNRKKRSLRQRIADWPPLNEAVASVFVLYLRLLRRTARWDADGYDAVEEAIARDGAAIVVFWHQSSLVATYSIDTSSTQARSLNADSRAGTLARAILRRFAYHTTPMPKGPAGRSAVRTVLRGLQEGITVGIAVDGPRGPARKSKAHPVQWARASGKQVFVFACAAKRFVRWPTWDRMIMPAPFTRVTLLWRPWLAEIPRRPDDQQIQALLEALDAALDAVTDEAEARIDHKNAG